MSIRAVLSVIVAIMSCGVAASDGGPAPTSIATIGLRGGFDSNPAAIAGERGSPAATIFATWDYIRGTNSDGYTVNLSLAGTHYDPRVLAAARAHGLTLRHAFSLGQTTTIQSTLTAGDEQTWSRRRGSLAWRERIDHGFGAFRVFASAEARITALNERNVFNLGDFLPRDENFVTLGVTPGLAWRSGATEIGVSATASRVTFTEGLDYLGLRRTHTRFQPNLFASTKLGEATLEGSLSPFRASFPQKDFDAVESLLYTVKAKLPHGAIALEFASSRSVEDTTLPFSAINLVTSHEARATVKWDEANAVSLVARRKTDDYVGLDARSDQKSVGLDYQRALVPGLTATASGILRKTKETGLAPVTSFSVLLGLQKQIDLGAGKAEKSGG